MTTGLDICELLAKGLTIKEATAKLGISRTAADWEVLKLKRQMQCETTFELMWQLGWRAATQAAIPRGKRRAAYLREYKKGQRRARASANSIGSGAGNLGGTPAHV